MEGTLLSILSHLRGIEQLERKLSFRILISLGTNILRMSWFLLLTGGQEAKEKPQPQPVPAPPWAEAQDCQDPSYQWEVLSQGEHSVQDREVEIQGIIPLKPKTAEMPAPQ